jgi:hypothetical protein
LVETGATALDGGDGVGLDDRRPQIGAIIVIERPRPPGTQGFALPIENEADSSRKDKMRLERSPRFLPKQHALCPVSFVAIASAMLRAAADEPVSSAREACPAR